MRTTAHWLEELAPGESLDVYRELARIHAERAGPFKDELLRLILQGDMRKLVEYSVDYTREGCNASNVYEARQALAYFSKLERLDVGVDREAKALSVFLSAEQRCSETNTLFCQRRVGDFQFSPRVEAVLFAAQRKIARILGPRPTVEALKFRFGPGATRGVKRKEASLRRKLSEDLSCSENLLPVVPAMLRQMPHLLSLHEAGMRVEVCEDYYDEWAQVPVIIRPSMLGFVPKNAMNLRTVVVECGLNVMFQLALGDHLAQRLAAFGIDIRDQTVNQRRAREGSLTGALATLDLVSASDTISTELVYELLPLDWAQLLNYGRSPLIETPAGLIEQSKFSSMGNGFTFPLQTLLFWALAASCCDDDNDATVYGDDIVVPTTAYDLLSEVLYSVGFIVNHRKSFRDGPFRESCGKDYYKGIDVRPTYPRGWVSGHTLFVLHNYYWRRGDLEIADRVASFIHPALKIWGPDGFGDGHLLGDHPRRRTSRMESAGYSGYLFDTYTRRVPRDGNLLPGDAVLPLYTIYRRGVERLNDLVPIDAPLPALPEVPAKAIKALPLPGDDGYKKVSIYTLG